MKNANEHAPFMNILPVELCPVCLNKRDFVPQEPCSEYVGYQCINPNCSELRKPILIDKTVYWVLRYIEETHKTIENHHT